MRKKWKAILALTLCAACLLSVPAFAVSFTDVSGHWAESYITQAAERELIQGYDGKYSPAEESPAGDMTEAEAKAIAAQAAGVEDT